MWFTVRGQQIDLAWISQVSGMSLIKNHGRLNLQFISNWLTLACMNFLAWVLSRIMPDLIFPRYLAISCNDKNARHFLDLARYFWYWYVWIMYLCMYVCMYHIIMYVNHINYQPAGWSELHSTLLPISFIYSSVGATSTVPSWICHCMLVPSCLIHIVYITMFLRAF